MCDTFVHVPARKDQPVLFGKNSDREPNEAQQIVRFPGQKREKNTIKATFIEVAHQHDVFEVILSKPFQLWGAEMGVNEHGVAIGNEAVFTKIPFEKKNTGLTGMDMIRLALEISKTAQAALENIIFYVEKYGQDACGGYKDRDFFYHNAFLVADKQEAYVLETAGNFWVYEKVSGYRAISNGLSIEEKYDGICPGAVDFARKKNRIGKHEPFNFKKAFSAFWMPKLAQCESRRQSNEKLGNSLGELTAGDAFRILRSHKTGDSFSPHRARPDSLCMHASGLFSPHQTTGSMVAELRNGARPTIWLTGTSAPCLSVYKPFYLGTDILDENNFPAPTAVRDNSYWWQWEILHRRMLGVYTECISEFRQRQHELETAWLRRDMELLESNAGAGSLAEFSAQALRQSVEMREDMLKEFRDKKAHRSGLMYEWYWKKWNKLAQIETA